MTPFARDFGDRLQALLRTPEAEALAYAELLEVVGLEAGMLIAECAVGAQIHPYQARAFFEAACDRAMAHTALNGFDPGKPS